MYTGRPLTEEQLLTPVPSDYVISNSITPIPIQELASNYGINEDELFLYGTVKAKVSLDVVKRLEDAPSGKYVLITGINPSSLGEGKSTTACGISQSLGAHHNKRVFTCLRQPSQGPTFGIKGGAAGGGYAQVIPMEEMNLHMTGDIHAITAGNNLLAAAIDTRWFHESYQSDANLFRRLTKGRTYFSPVQMKRLKKLGINKTEPNDLTEEEIHAWARLDIVQDSISFNRVIDTNDRYLRRIEIGLSPSEKGRGRTTNFDISVASELMAIMGLATSLQDLRERVGRVVVAQNSVGEGIEAEDIGCAGAVAVLLKDTLQPTLMQTAEGTPVFIQAGPFANIAHGNSAIVCDQIALKLVGEDGYVVTEAGFGADMGMEKFFNIKCRYSGLVPNCTVIVASIRALKLNGGCSLPDTKLPNLEALQNGFCNLEKHIENACKFGIPVVVCINRFNFDVQDEIDWLREACLQTGAFDCVPSYHWARGGAGAFDVAAAVIRACEEESEFQFLYPLDLPLKEKMEIIAREIYGADGIEFTDEAEADILKLNRLGLGGLPICYAKTQYSLSHDSKLLGRPTGFTIPIREVRGYMGAGFVVPICGVISTMPGLPTRPCFFDIDIDTETGVVLGIS